MPVTDRTAASVLTKPKAPRQPKPDKYRPSTALVQLDLSGVGNGLETDLNEGYSGQNFGRASRGGKGGTASAYPPQNEIVFHYGHCQSITYQV